MLTRINLLQINLRTVYMNRADGAGCAGSNVSIYQATTRESDRKVTLCGRQSDVTVFTSSANRVFVRLYGRTLDREPKFKMVYSMVHRGRLHVSSCKVQSYYNARMV